MRAPRIALAAMALGACALGCQYESAKPKREQPVAGFPPGSQDLPAPPTVMPSGPSVVGVNLMHADDGQLAHMRIAFLATDGFDQADLVQPRQAYSNEGATTIIVSNKMGTIQGYEREAKADSVKVDLPIEDTTAGEFDALVLPGGILSADKLRLDPNVMVFVRSFARSGKPIAAICHGLWLMVENDLVRGRTLTSCPSLRTDLKNAGAKWVDQDVVEDRNLVTSRRADDIPAFDDKTVALFAKQGDHGAQRPAIGGGPPPTP
jgi:protease I